MVATAPVRERLHVVPAAPLPRALRSISCVVPCYNEAANLRLLLPRLVRALQALKADWEVVLVDDGSQDDTAAVIASWQSQPRIRAIELSRNFGKEAALSAGLDRARGEVVVLLDADLQHEPERIAELVERWRHGAEMVGMVRHDRRDEGLVKRTGTRLFYRFMNADRRVRVVPDAGDFRLLDRSVVEALRRLPERTRFMKGLYAWVGFRSETIEYTPADRAHGHSHFRLRSLLRLSIDGLTAFTTWPLRAASVVGLLLACAAFAYGLYLVASYFVWGHPVTGWTTIVVGMALLSGVQLVCLGIVGEYLARVFDEVKSRPLYVVRRASGGGLGTGHP